MSFTSLLDGDKPEDLNLVEKNKHLNTFTTCNNQEENSIVPTESDAQITDGPSSPVIWHRSSRTGCEL